MKRMEAVEKLKTINNKQSYAIERILTDDIVNGLEVKFSLDKNSIILTIYNNHHVLNISPVDNLYSLVYNVVNGEERTVMSLSNANIGTVLDYVNIIKNVYNQEEDSFE